MSGRGRTHGMRGVTPFIVLQIIGLLIILLSIAAVGLIIEHAISIRKGALIPEMTLLELEELIHNQEIDNAIPEPRDETRDATAEVAERARLGGLLRYNHRAA